jgi:hypothetical protein
MKNSKRTNEHFACVSLYKGRIYGDSKNYNLNNYITGYMKDETKFNASSCTCICLYIIHISVQILRSYCISKTLIITDTA